MNKPVVFVSSAIQGMRRTRSSIKNFIEEKLGYTVIMSEYEGSKSKTPVAQCKKWAKECDIFISILGKRYGWEIPGLGISVSEMEYNEAYKDNPEKILVFVSSQSKETRQDEFVERIADFKKGYFRRNPYGSDQQLVEGIKEDIAEFFKERLVFLKAKGLRVKKELTPSVADYASYDLHKRYEVMQADAISVSQQMGFHTVLYIKPYFLLSTKYINRIKVLFTIDTVTGNYNRSEIFDYNNLYQREVRYTQQYIQFFNRFAITFVHGNANLRSLEWLTHHFGGTCCKVEPGLFYREGLYEQKQTPNGTFFENRLVLSGIKNRQNMVISLSNAIEWILKESKRINFKCNNEKPLKIKLMKYKRGVKR